MNPLGGRCLRLSLTGDESVDEVMRIAGVPRESAAELLAFAKRLRAKAEATRGTDNKGGAA